MFVLLTALFAQSSVTCTAPRIRNDFREVDASGNWNKVVAAYKEMQKTGRIAYYAELHKEIFSIVHGTIRFFTWHRAMLWEFENEMQAISGNDTTLPFIDWSAEATAFTGLVDQSAAITPTFYAKQNGTCLEGQIYDSFALLNDTRGPCITRATGTTQTLLSGWADVDIQVATRPLFEDFSTAIEQGLHADVHVLFGGLMGGVSSPLDPLFFAHHAYVDMVFNNWQFLHGFAPTTTDFGETSFEINGKTYNHMDVFNMVGTCSQYRRTDLPRTAASAVPALVAPQDPPSGTTLEYSIKVETFYNELKLNIASLEKIRKTIATFYNSSFIPRDNRLSPAAVAKLGLDQANYTRFITNREAQRKDLAANSGFPYKTFQEVKIKVVDNLIVTE